MRNFWFLTLVLFGSVACQTTPKPPKTTNTNWMANLPGTVALSSPRVADLNADGVDDVLMGAGSTEWHRSDTAIIALDGRDGELLWRRPARNQIFGSATFLDINHDKTPDVIIGGRSAELQAINGRTGALIWEFLQTTDPMGHKKAGWFNFTNAQLVPDIDNDGLDDLLIANGGDATIADTQRPRPVGRLLILSSRTGKVLREARMPDGRETYCSPVLVKQPGQPANRWTLLFGTGGEAIGGHFYRTTLSALMQGDLSKAVPLADERYKGFCAPAVVCDLNADAVPDFVLNTVAGRTLAINGATNKLIWQFSYPSCETFSVPAPGYFVGKDSIPDFFVNYAVGVYPFYSNGLSFLLDGKTGRVVKQFSAGSFSYASPLTADFNNDNHDDGLLVVNDDREKGGKWRAFASLRVYDFHNNRQFNLTDSLPGANFAITPWLGDLDHDGKLDVLFGTTAAIVKTFPGKDRTDVVPLQVRVARRKLAQLPAKNNVGKPPKWSSYMGPRADGIFRN
jgi:outer membrane protein assembly factor BamB